MAAPVAWCMPPGGRTVHLVVRRFQGVAKHYSLKFRRGDRALACDRLRWPGVIWSPTGLNPRLRRVALSCRLLPFGFRVFRLLIHRYRAS